MKRVLDNFLLLVLILIVVTLIALAGYSYGRAFPVVQYIPKSEYVWLPPLTVKETEYVIAPSTFITKIVEKEVERVLLVPQVSVVVITRNVTQLLTDWESLDELKQFLASDNTSETILLKNKSSLTGSIDSSGIYAVSLRANANRIGRYLDVIEIYGTEYGWWYGKVVGAGVTHGANRAKVWMGEYWAVYYIDPQTDRLWWVFNT